MKRVLNPVGREDAPPGPPFWLILWPGDELVESGLERESFLRTKGKLVKQAKICMRKQ